MTIIAAVLAVSLIAVVFLFLRLKREIEEWRRTAIEIANRFAYYIPDEATGCWVWQKGKDPRGYGRVYRRSGRSALAHRLMYERFRGPIPHGLVLDHLCCNTSCVNPDHLEPVTQAENTRRWREGNPEQAAAQWQRVRSARYRR